MDLSLIGHNLQKRFNYFPLGLKLHIRFLETEHTAADCVSMIFAPAHSHFDYSSILEIHPQFDLIEFPNIS